MSKKKPWEEGSFLWFVFSLAVPPALTIVGLISAWLLFGAGEVSDLLAEQRQRELEVIKSELQTEAAMQLELFKSELKKPSFEYQIALGPNPAAQYAPEVITETIKIMNTGPATATDVRLHAELGVRALDGAIAKLQSKDFEFYRPSESAVRFVFTKLQAGESVEVDIPLALQEIRQLPYATVYDFLKDQSIHVTCDEGRPEVTQAAEPTIIMKPAGAPRTHIVQPGETLLSISRFYGVSPWAFVEANGLLNPDYTYPGQILVVP